MDQIPKPTLFVPQAIPIQALGTATGKQHTTLFKGFAQGRHPQAGSGIGAHIALAQTLVQHIGGMVEPRMQARVCV